jgi:cell division protein FtsW
MKTTTAPTTMPTPAMNRTLMAAGTDGWMVAAVMFLLGMGCLLVYSSSAIRAGQSGGDTTYYLVRHLGAVGLGLAAMEVTRRIPVDAWNRLAYPLLLVTVALLAATLWSPWGRTVNGAARWLSLGPFSLQPGEVAKLAVVLYLAHSLAKKREQASSFSVGFLPHVAVTAVVAGLLLAQPDLGTAAVLFVTMGGLLFVAGTRLGYLAGAAALACPVVLHYVASRPHALRRLLAFTQPEAHRADVGYQTWESLVAFGSGGWTGHGLGGGSQKLFFLPEGHTDFVFAVLGQEVGFIGVVSVIAAFAVLLGRTFAVAHRLPCRFPMFLVFGIGLVVAVQAATHMAVSMALLPTKGLTLPLLSFGRTSLVVTLASLGIVLRASAEAHGLHERGTG